MYGFHPAHITTRGRFDGVYGIATRGYLILPDVVPRFPGDADLFVEADQLGTLQPEGLWGQFGDHDDLTLLAFLDANAQGLEAILSEDLVKTMVARAESLDMSAEVMEMLAELGRAVDDELDTELAVDDDIGGATEEDAASTVEVDDLVGDVDGDEPPHY